MNVVVDGYKAPGLLTVWASCPGSLLLEASPSVSTPWDSHRCPSGALQSHTHTHTHTQTQLAIAQTFIEKVHCPPKVTFRNDSPEITWKPSQKSRTLTSEMMEQFLQLTRSTSWSPNSLLKASGCQRLLFSRLCIPETNTGYRREERLQSSLFSI